MKISLSMRNYVIFDETFPHSLLLPPSSPPTPISISRPAHHPDTHELIVGRPYPTRRDLTVTAKTENI